jgi:regulator of sirC expression with transglutaminase-like and TPR domain
MSDLPSFADLAGDPAARLDLLALALAAELQDEVDAAAALATLDALGAELAGAVARVPDDPAAQLRVCADLLGAVHGFTGDSDDYDHPDNSMLDLVLERRRGLPILLSVVYVEVARRAGVPLAGVGLPGHFVVGHFGGPEVLLADPFDGGALLPPGTAGPGFVRPWAPAEVAMRMLNNLVAGHTRRGDFGLAIRAAKLRLLLPADEALRETLEVELRGMQATLN